ncbi:MAG TPA: DUF4199 domain-containing protein [Steroidobacteraceae bacterium]|jgi:hypothetical protein|nr:DUF4199 domain-containing protein [Steroidobacteraceae bacterium]
MTSSIVRYGIIAGLIVAIPMLWQMLVRGELAESLLLGYAIMIVALTAVFLGVKQYRDKKLGGVIRFLPALGVGLGISTVACLFYVAAWEISLAFSDFDFARFYTNAMIEAAKAKNASPAEIQQAVTDAQSFAKMYANPLVRMPITFVEMFPVGVLISLISAGLLRNSKFLPARGAN